VAVVRCNSSKPSSYCMLTPLFTTNLTAATVSRLCSATKTHLEHELAKVQLGRHFKGARSRDDLIAAGILIDQSPAVHALDLNLRKDALKHSLERRTSAGDLKVTRTLQ
jgi:hypothetical protein